MRVSGARFATFGSAGRYTRECGALHSGVRGATLGSAGATFGSVVCYIECGSLLTGVWFATHGSAGHGALHSGVRGATFRSAGCYTFGTHQHNSIVLIIILVKPYVVAVTSSGL